MYELDFAKLRQNLVIKWADYGVRMNFGNYNWQDVIWGLEALYSGLKLEANLLLMIYLNLFMLRLYEYEYEN